MRTASNRWLREPLLHFLILGARDHTRVAALKGQLDRRWYLGDPAEYHFQARVGFAGLARREERGTGTERRARAATADRTGVH